MNVELPTRQPSPREFRVCSRTQTSCDSVKRCSHQPLLQMSTLWNREVRKRVQGHPAEVVGRSAKFSQAIKESWQKGEKVGCGHGSWGVRRPPGPGQPVTVAGRHLAGWLRRSL